MTRAARFILIALGLLLFVGILIAVFKSGGNAAATPAATPATTPATINASGFFQLISTLQQQKDDQFVRILSRNFVNFLQSNGTSTVSLSTSGLTNNKTKTQLVCQQYGSFPTLMVVDQLGNVIKQKQFKISSVSGEKLAESVGGQPNALFSVNLNVLDAGNFTITLDVQYPSSNTAKLYDSGTSAAANPNYKFKGPYVFAIDANNDLVFFDAGTGTQLWNDKQQNVVPLQKPQQLPIPGVDFTASQFGQLISFKFGSKNIRCISSISSADGDLWKSGECLSNGLQSAYLYAGTIAIYNNATLQGQDPARVDSTVAQVTQQGQLRVFKNAQDMQNQNPSQKSRFGAPIFLAGPFVLRFDRFGELILYDSKTMTKYWDSYRDGFAGASNIGSQQFSILQNSEIA